MSKLSNKISSLYLKFPRNPVREKIDNGSAVVSVVLQNEHIGEATYFDPTGPGFFWVPGPGWGLGAESVYNSKTIHVIKMKLGSIVETHKLIDLT